MPNTPTKPESVQPGEGLVVTEGGIRVSKTVHATTTEAAAEAAARKRQLHEKTGDGSAVKVVQTLHG